MRILRRTVMVTSLVAGALVLAAVMLLAALHTDAGRAIVRDRLVAVLAEATRGRVALGRVETPQLGTIVLHDLVISLAPRSVLRARRVEIALALPQPAPLVLRLRRLRVDGLVAHLTGGLGDREESPRERDVPGLRIGALEVRKARLGMLLADGTRRRHVALSDLSIDGALASGPRGAWLALTSLTTTPRGLPLEPLAAAFTLRARRDGALDLPAFALTSGGTRLVGAGQRDADGRLDVRAHAEPLASNLLARVAPGLVLPEGSRIDLALRGAPSALAGTGRVDLAAAGSLAVRARGDAVAATRSYRIAIEARDLVPGALHPDWPRERLQASLRGRGHGTRHLARGQATTEAASLVWRGRAALGTSATYRLSASGQVRDLARLAGTAGRFPFRLEASAAGALPEPEQAWLALEIGSGSLGSAAVRRAMASAHLEHRAVVADFDVMLAAGSQAAATIALAQERRVWTGQLRTLHLSPEGLSTWTSDGPARLAFRHGVQLDGLRLRSGDQRAVLSAAAGARGALEGTLDVSDVQLAPLCTLAGTSCAGRLTGRIEASGTTAAPRLAITAAGRDVAAGPVAETTIDAHIRHEHGRATGTVTIASLGGSVVASGGVPAPLPGRRSESDALDLTITARDLALNRLPGWAPRIVASARGRLRADLHVGGTWAAPRPTGTLALRAPVLELVASGAEWENVDVELRADGGRKLAIERLTASGGTGTLTGSGHFDFDAGLIPNADVRLAFDHFLAVDRPIVEAAVNGTLRLRGPLTGPTVRGRLYVPSGALRPAFLPRANAPTERDHTIEVVGLPEDVTVAPAPGLGELTLGLTITLGNGMRIRRRDADIRLGGTLRVERTPPEPLTVRGTVEVERGWYTFQGRRFTMRGGEVRFGGGPIGEAELDLEAARRVGEYDVTVAVQGTVAKPELILSSDPPLDEPDVLAVLLVGRPSGELSDSERASVQAEAASLAVGYLVPGLEGAFTETLPVEQVQVSQEEVRIGRHFGDDVFVSLSQQFVGYAGQTVSVEYTITRRLSVELSTSSRGSGAVDLFWRRRY